MENSEKKGRKSVGTSTTPNPAKYFIQWKSKNEAFSYYNNDKKEDVLMPKPFSFIPLYMCYTLKGYNHKKGLTYIANEIENLESDVLTVKAYDFEKKTNSVVASGLYKDIKEDLDDNVKFTISLYIGIKPKKGDMLLANIQMNGSALHHWFDFAKKNDLAKIGIKVEKDTEEKNGSVKYKAPVYESYEITDKDDEAAGELQQEIEAYLKEYFSKNRASMSSKVNENQDNGLNKSAKSEHKKETSSKQKDIVVKEEDDDDSDDLPF